MFHKSVLLLLVLGSLVFAACTPQNSVLEKVREPVVQQVSPPPTIVSIGGAQPEREIDKQDDWETYTNKEQGYSIKIHPSWSVNPDFGLGPVPKYGTTVISSAPLLFSEKEIGNDSIIPEGESFFSIIFEGDNKSHEQSIEDYLGTFNHVQRVRKLREVSLNAKIFGYEEQGELGRAIHIVRDNKVFAISIPNTNTESHTAIITSMLATFQFLE